MNRRLVYILLIFPVLLDSCVLNETPDNIPIPGYRTVLFYLVGNGNFSEEIQPRLDALQEMWSNELGLGGHLLVYTGGNSDHPPCLMEMVEDNLTGEVSVKVLCEYKGSNSVPSETFSRVINDMYTFYPSQDYGLVLFSRGSGWLPAENLEFPRRRRSVVETRSLISEGEKSFELRDFALAIPDGQFSFIVFESGFMAGLEVAYELRDKTDYLIASSTEIPDPGFLPVYGEMLPELFRAYPYYKKAAKAYFDYYNQLSCDLCSATISVINTSKLELLKQVLNNAESRVTDWEEIERRYLQSFDRRKSGHLFYDLQNYIDLIGNEEERTAFANSLGEVVVYESATNHFLSESEEGFDITSHCGLTIYIPDVHYPYLNGQRQLLRLFQ